MSDWAAAPRGRKTVYGRIGIWRRPDGQIAIRLGPSRGEISTVAPDPSSSRGNPHLYSKLRTILIEQGCWPQGTDGEPVP